jgi:hypothetical protein
MRFEILCQELANGGALLRQLASGLTPAEARHKPGPTAWSILEVICHLYDEEREDFRQRLDFILHRPDQPLPPIDPQGWVTARQYNERDLAEMLDQFAAERQRSLDWLKTLSGANWDAVYTNEFGTIRAGDMLSAWVAHDNLHLRQLVELRRERVVAITAPYETIYAGEW